VCIEVCMCVCIEVCMCVCIEVCMCVCIEVYMCVCIEVCMCVCIEVRMCVSTSVCISNFVCIEPVVALSREIAVFTNLQPHNTPTLFWYMCQQVKKKLARMYALIDLKTRDRITHLFLLFQFPEILFCFKLLSPSCTLLLSYTGRTSTSATYSFRP